MRVRYGPVTVTQKVYVTLSVTVGVTREVARLSAM